MPTDKKPMGESTRSMSSIAISVYQLTDAQSTAIEQVDDSADGAAVKIGNDLNEHGSIYERLRNRRWRPQGAEVALFCC